jgi:hypothetical protein
VELARSAHAVLAENWLGAATRPGPRLYPHWATPRGNTSGIVQPPLHATAAWLVARRAPSPEAARAFLGELFGPLRPWGWVGERGFWEYHDPETGEGLGSERFS